MTIEGAQEHLQERGYDVKGIRVLPIPGCVVAIRTRYRGKTRRFILEGGELRESPNRERKKLVARAKAGRKLKRRKRAVQQN